jgi:hypothetical protein
MTQEFSSAMTSINSKKLPAVYHKINWERLHKDHNIIRVLDFGSGRYINHIKQFVNQNWGIYYPYDSYWMSELQNEVSLNCHPDIIICSNLLNVIKEEEIINEIIQTLLNYNCPVVFSIYEGDKSGIGRETKKGCWQRNEVIKPYFIPYLNNKEIIPFHGLWTTDKTILL